MTREEKQKAIDALKISAPVMPVTQEKFMDYVQTLNKIMDWLEQEPQSDIEAIRQEIENMPVLEDALHMNTVRKYKVLSIIDNHIQKPQERSDKE